MLKRKRKENKALLIAESRIYGKTRARCELARFRAFRQLARFHGVPLACAMMQDAFLNAGAHLRSDTCDVWGFVVWSDTNYWDQWQVVGDAA
ncbi:hypothetical protein Atoyac1_21 [Aeromonas phage Atoyac1]|uniref:Uncharacterized protein n=1 Tax=Aeromonas phage Atoyac1 TaxID=2767547 RepID=A0A866D167_9CAUD|nr:hypothetical protein Atoyac1_21 [Aeromonas phage Atoyac1]